MTVKVIVFYDVVSCSVQTDTNISDAAYSSTVLNIYMR